MVKKGLMTLGALVTQQIIIFLNTMLRITLSLMANFQVDALHNLVPFVQFSKREKLPWRSIIFSKVSLQLC